MIGVAAFALEDGGEADGVAAEGGGDLGEDAGPVVGHEADVVARAELVEGEDVGLGSEVGVGAELFEGQGCCAQGDADEIGDDGGGGGGSACAAAVEEGVAEGVAVDADGVEGAGDVGQDVVLVNEGGVDAEGEGRMFRGGGGVVGVAFGDGEELDDVAEFFGEEDVVGLEAVDAFEMDIRFGDADIKGEAGENGEFLCGVAAGDIEGGVGLGEALFLGFFEGVVVGPGVAGHLCEDEVAGAVDDAEDGVDAVGDKAAEDGVDDGDAAADGGFEGDAGIVLASEGEEFVAAEGEEGLVGGDDGFTEAEGAFDKGIGDGDAADEFDDDMAVGVVDGGVGVGGHGELGGVGGVVFGAFDGDMAELEVEAGATEEGVVMIAEDIDDAAADGSAAEEGNANGFVRHGVSPFGVRGDCKVGWSGNQGGEAGRMGRKCDAQVAKSDFSGVLAAEVEAGPGVRVFAV